MVYSTPSSFGTAGGPLTTDVRFNQYISGQEDIYRILPNVAQGLNQDQRIANQIEPKSLLLKLAVQLVQPSKEVFGELSPGGNTYSYPENITCHIFILRSRQVDDPALVVNIPIDQLMMIGPGMGTKPFDGSYWNSRLAVNTNQFTAIKHIKLHLRKGSSWYSYVNNCNVNGTSIPAQLPQDGAYSSPDQALKEFNIRIPVPKKLIYTNETFEQPKNFFPFMAVGWTKNEYPVSTAWTRSFYPLAISARTLFKFNDL